MSVSARERCCFVGDPFAGVGVERPAQRVEKQQPIRTQQAPVEPVGETQTTRAEVTQPPQQEATPEDQYSNIGRGGYFVSRRGL